MAKTILRLVFSVTGENFSPTIFTNTIGLSPTNSWVVNDPIPNRPNRFRKESAWVYQIGPVEDLFKSTHPIKNHYSEL